MTGPVVLAVNPGSSSLKVAVRTPELVLTARFDRLGAAQGKVTIAHPAAPDAADEVEPFTGDLPAALGQVADVLSRNAIHPDVISHRVVHGGPAHTSITRVDEQLLADLRDTIPLAPLHLPSDIASIEASISEWPDATQVACFDTAFHAALPERSVRLPVAAELAARGIRRYGFHGLSIQSVLRARPDLDQLVIAHLGSGCSVSAVADGRPRHTTMSFTPTGGMMSSTRSGDLDPEIVLYLVEQAGLPVGELRDLLDRQSGLAGIADGRRDVRDVESADDPAARLALDVFVHQTAAAVAACAITLDRFDTLVFTGGVGEHSAAIRQRVCGLLSGLRGSGSDLRVLVVPADEESVLDAEARALSGP